MYNVNLSKRALTGDIQRTDRLEVTSESAYIHNRAAPGKTCLDIRPDSVHYYSFAFCTVQETFPNSYFTHSSRAFAQHSLFKSWDSTAWNLWAAEAQSRSTKSQPSAETVPSRPSSLPGIWRYWDQYFKGFGYSVHINTISNLCAQSLEVIWNPGWVSGFLFLVCVFLPKHWGSRSTYKSIY